MTAEREVMPLRLLLSNDPAAAPGGAGESSLSHNRVVLEGVAYWSGSQ